MYWLPTPDSSIFVSGSDATTIYALNTDKMTRKTELLSRSSITKIYQAIIKSDVNLYKTRLTCNLAYEHNKIK